MATEGAGTESEVPVGRAVLQAINLGGNYLVLVLETLSTELILTTLQPVFIMSTECYAQCNL